MKKDFAPLLLGKDRRSIPRSEKVVGSVTDQESFDELFGFLLHHERLLVMRAADAIEKISAVHPEYLERHKKQLLGLLKSALHIELKWHLALLISRIALDAEELKAVWSILTYWACNPNESKIARVNSLQGLFELSRRYPHLQESFYHTLGALEHERIPSMVARIKKLRHQRP